LVEIRVLVALEDEYRAYREVIAAGIQVFRPHLEVASTGLDALEEEVARLDPHLVICSLPAGAGCSGRLAWVELSLDPSRPSVVCVDGRYSKLHNPTLDALVGIVDDERLLKLQANLEHSHNPLQ
jgi:hypothetical protein